MKPLTPNTMIQNRYLIVQPIGKGGMGDVYLAVDQRLGSAVALKRTFFADDGALGSAFEREARILARLRHPVLPKVIDHFAENGDQYLVMEHISGDDLSKRLEGQNKPFPLKWVMFWADQLLDALSYLHTHEPPIIHRDIKPQNLKLTDENHIVLLDFGLSKDFDSSSPANGLNSASVAGYSPHFAAMEQIRGTGTDGRSDLFSLSATLYQLLTNSIPCEALTRADAILGGKADPIKPVGELNPEVPAAVSDVILKGIALRQNERYSTAAEMQRALRRAYNRGEAAPSAQKPEAAPAKVEAAPAAELPSTPAATEPKFDATFRVEQAVSNPSRLQADVKTEVLRPTDLAGISGLTTDQNSQPRTDTGSSAKQSVAGAAAAAGAASPAADVDSVLTRVSPSPTQKSRPASKSRTGLILTGVIGLLALTAIAAGGGWYAYKTYYAAGVPKPAPTVASDPTPSVPTPEPVATVTSASVPSDTSPPANVDASNVETPATPGTIASKPGAQPPRPGAPRSGKTPAPKAADKPKPKDDRTVILQ